MATYPPPTQNQAIFNASNFSSYEDALTEAVANTLYLKYPISQGSETITGALTVSEGASITGALSVSQGATITGALSVAQGTAITGNLSTAAEFTSTQRAFLDGGVDVGDTAAFGTSVDVGTNLILSGTPSTNYIQFPDGTQQFTSAVNTTTFNTNVTFNENILIPNAGSYIQFPDGSRLLSANGTSSVSSTNTWIPYNPSSPTLLTYNLKPFVLFNITPLSGTPKSFTVLTSGGGGNNGSNNTSGATRYYGGSGGAGGAITAGVTYSTAQTATGTILSACMYPDCRPASILSALSVQWAGSLTSANGLSTLTYTGSLTGYTASNFQNITAGSIVYAVIRDITSRPYIISAWVFLRTATQLITGIIGASDTAYVGLATPVSTSSILYYVYNNASQYDTTGTLTINQVSGTLTSVTITSLSGQALAVGDIIAGYMTSGGQAFYSYIANISSSVPTQTITLANSFTISGTITTTTGLTFYATRPVNGTSFFTRITSGTKDLGTVFGGSVGGNASSSAVGSLGLGGTSILNASTGFTTSTATGANGSAGYSNTTPFLTGATTQAFNSLATSNNTTTSVSPFSAGGFTASTANPNPTATSIGGTGCIFVQCFT